MDASLATAIASVLVAFVAAVAAWASARAAARAQNHDTDVSTEAKRLEQAYERARAFDIQTIQRQDTEIEELRESEAELNAQVVALRLRVTNLEVEVQKYKRQVATLKKENNNES